MIANNACSGSVPSILGLQLFLSPALENPTFSSGFSGHLYSHVHILICVNVSMYVCACPHTYTLMILEKTLSFNFTIKGQKEGGEKGERSQNCQDEQGRRYIFQST